MMPIGEPEKHYILRDIRGNVNMSKIIQIKRCIYGIIECMNTTIQKLKQPAERRMSKHTFCLPQVLRSMLKADAMCCGVSEGEIVRMALDVRFDTLNARLAEENNRLEAEIQACK